MGFFGSSADSSDASSSDTSPADRLEDVDPQEEPEVASPMEPTGDHVSIAQPLSRRAKARQEVEDRTRRTVDEATSDLRKRLEDQGTSFATLTGTIQALQAQIQAQQASASQRPATGSPGPSGDDPDDLQAQAEAALDRQDYTSYKQLTRKATAALARQIAREEMKGFQPASAPQQFHPAVMAQAIQFPKVMEKDPDLRMVRIKDEELEFLGVPAGPARLRRAFEAANQIFGSNTPATPAYSQSSAAVLSGVPTSNNQQAASAKGPGIQLSPYQKSIARQFKMTDEEYARDLAKVRPDLVRK